MNLKPLKILGLMSGTSLDGMDMALCEFRCNDGKYSYRLLKATTVEYPEHLSTGLRNSMRLSSPGLISLDHEYGKWIGIQCREFIELSGMEVSLIASHGHTVFHDPGRSYTLQIGNGHDISAVTGLDVIFDFRSKDIALGGQGAPLVPAGDRLLFGEFAACLNIGGISNISYEHEGKRIAFDICPVNMTLNYLAGKQGKSFDKDGEGGRLGKLIPLLFDDLEQLEYYSIDPPKSLGKEWFERKFLPLIENAENVNDVLHTVYHHISRRIAAALKPFTGKKILVTGGGAHNSFLTGLISAKTDAIIHIPGNELVDFKEAIIFGFLGYLRYYDLVNTFSSSTGARMDSSGGVFVKSEDRARGARGR